MSLKLGVAYFVHQRRRRFQCPPQEQQLQYSDSSFVVRRPCCIHPPRQMLYVSRGVSSLPVSSSSFLALLVAIDLLVQSQPFSRSHQSTYHQLLRHHHHHLCHFDLRVSPRQLQLVFFAFSWELRLLWPFCVRRLVAVALIRVLHCL